MSRNITTIIYRILQFDGDFFDEEFFNSFIEMLLKLEIHNFKSVEEFRLSKEELVFISEVVVIFLKSIKMDNPLIVKNLNIYLN